MDEKLLIVSRIREKLENTTVSIHFDITKITKFKGPIYFYNFSINKDKLSTKGLFKKSSLFLKLH